MLAKVYKTSRKDFLWMVVYRDQSKREKNGRAKRVVKWCKTKGEAEEKQRELNEKITMVGTTGIIFDDHALRADAVGARTLLNEAGLHAVKLIDLARAEILRSGAARDEHQAVAAEQAMEQFCDMKAVEENKSDQTVSDLKKRLKRWFKRQGIGTLGDITAASVENVRRGMSVKGGGEARLLGAKTRSNDLNAVRGFCEWLARPHQQMLMENPAANVAFVKQDKRRPLAWSVAESQRFMRAAAGFRAGALVPAVIARLFAGVRPSEMQSSRVVKNGRQWFIRVEGGKLRGRANRAVPLASNAVAWLKRFPSKDGKLPFVSKRAWQELRRRVNADGHDPVTWVQDIARHTFIGYRLALTENESQVAREAGNSPDEIYSSYFQLRTKGEAARFFKIMPPVTCAKPR